MKSSFIRGILEDFSAMNPTNSITARPKMVPLSASRQSSSKEFTDYFFESVEVPTNSIPITPKQKPEPAMNKPVYVPNPEKESLKPYDLFKFLEDTFLFGVRKSAKRGEASYLYLYNPKPGDYSHLLPGEFDELVRGLKNLPSAFFDVITSNFLKETYRWICSSRKTKHLPVRVPTNMINVTNGTLLLDKKSGTIKLVAHDKKYLLFNSLKAAYVPCSMEQWQKTRMYRFLKRFSNPDYGEDGVNFLVYMLGKIFTNIRTGKSIYYIYGPTDVGKGRLCQSIVAILGEENCKELSLHTFLDRFGPVELLDKMLNISYDENTATWTKKLAAVLKTISAHDPMRGDIKNRQPISFTPNAVLLCFGNEKPLYSEDVDAGGAVSNRLNCFRTGASVPKEEQEEDLAEQLEKEKNFIFSYCVRYFIEHDEPEKLEKDASGQKIGFANITAKQGFKLWASEQVGPVEGAEMGSEDFYRCYLKYLGENGITEALKLKAFQMDFAKYYKNFKGSRVDNKVRYKGLGVLDQPKEKQE